MPIPDQFQFQFQKRDEYFTPDYVVFPIMKRLKAGAVVWCPFDTAESAFVRVLSAHGFCVIYGHIRTGQDFFTSDVPDCDYIVSNPPYSRKDMVLKRLYELESHLLCLSIFKGYLTSRSVSRCLRKIAWKCYGLAQE